MATFYVSTERVNRNPVRVQTWNASIRAGDDFKLAMTVYGDDNGTPASVEAAGALLTLVRDDAGYAHSCDYGLGWATGGTAIPGAGVAMLQSTGFATPVRGGGINFSLTQAQTASLYGRYRLIVMVDLADGSFTQFEGIIQIRGTHYSLSAPLLLHVDGAFFTFNVSELDVGILAALVINGVPVDADGFPLLVITDDPISLDILTQLLLSLPTTLPDLAGVLWLDGGVLALS